MNCDKSKTKMRDSQVLGYMNDEINLDSMLSQQNKASDATIKPENGTTTEVEINAV